MEENDNSGYKEEMQEAKILDSVRLDQRDSLLIILKSQAVLLHNRSHEAVDLDEQIRVAEMIAALVEAYYVISEL